MSEFVVYSVPGSPFGRAVLATLEEKGADYRLVPMTPAMVKAPEHLARHPFGRVPVLEHDGFQVYESQAILRYLDRVLPAPALTPADPKAAARMDQAMNVNDWYLFHGAGNVIGFQRVVAPRLLGMAPDEAACATALPATQRVFAVFDRMLGDTPYLAGAEPSLADLLVAPQVDFLTVTPEWPELSGPNPRLVAWLARMTARPSLRATTWERVAAIAEAA
jgi:glutathione S-transferase